MFSYHERISSLSFITDSYPIFKVPEKLPVSSMDYGLKGWVTVDSSSLNYADMDLIWSTEFDQNWQILYVVG